ncbi:MAG: holo-ACP synthase [Acidobacteria bacterium]|nr:holo-ACP synthase [Acidobacteriota bacterium]
MIIGIGTDLVEIARVREALERFGARFEQKVFTEKEIAYCRSKHKGAAESFAARFAAKEAAAKALGTGISRGISWREIEVIRSRGSRPELVFHGRAEERATMLGAQKSHLSLTHGRESAMAIVILESV